MHLLKSKFVVFAAAFSFTLLAYYSYGLFSAPPKNEFHLQFFTQGYNFRKFQARDKDFASYRVGEKIDIKSFLSSEGNQPPPAETKDNLLLFVVINPRCPFCELSKDIMGEIKQTAARLNIAYHPVLISPLPPQSNLKEYAQSIGFKDSFHWKTAPEKFVLMPTPAHVLVNRDGVILQVWFSSNRDEEIRKRMSEQISSDLSLIHEVVNAVPAGAEN
jgi:hypothetical protein